MSLTDSLSRWCHREATSAHLLRPNTMINMKALVLWGPPLSPASCFAESPDQCAAAKVRFKHACPKITNFLPITILLHVQFLSGKEGLRVTFRRGMVVLRVSPKFCEDFRGNAPLCSTPLSDYSLSICLYVIDVVFFLLSLCISGYLLSLSNIALLSSWCLPLSLSLYISLSTSLFFFSLSLSLSLYISLFSLYIFFSLSLSLSFYLSRSLCFLLSFFLFLSLSPYISLSLSLFDVFVVFPHIYICMPESY